VYLAAATSTRRRAEVSGTCHDHRKKSRSTWHLPSPQEEEQKYLAVAMTIRRRADSTWQSSRAQEEEQILPGSLHEHKKNSRYTWHLP